MMSATYRMSETALRYEYIQKTHMYEDQTLIRMHVQKLLIDYIHELIAAW